MFPLTQTFHRLSIFTHIPTRTDTTMYTHMPAHYSHSTRWKPTKAIAEGTVEGHTGPNDVFMWPTVPAFDGGLHARADCQIKIHWVIKSHLWAANIDLPLCQLGVLDWVKNVLCGCQYRQLWLGWGILEVTVCFLPSQDDRGHNRFARAPMEEHYKGRNCLALLTPPSVLDDLRLILTCLSCSFAKTRMNIPGDMGWQRQTPFILWYGKEPCFTCHGSHIHQSESGYNCPISLAAQRTCSQADRWWWSAVDTPERPK